MSKLLHHQIQYVEFHSPDFETTKKFYGNVFDWKFVDYGENYLAFEGTNVDGGFAKGEPKVGTTLPVIYSEDLESTEKQVIKHGGEVVRGIFSFPGGRRFEFTDPHSNRVAVWSDVT